jgi:hypothetical protein
VRIAAELDVGVAPDVTDGSGGDDAAELGAADGNRLRLADGDTAVPQPATMNVSAMPTAAQ